MFYARKRWGRGRLRQLAALAYCRMIDHDWGRPSEGHQCCRRGCGACRREEVVHAAPILTVTPCCGLTAFELPRTDRMMNDRRLVTCRGRDVPPEGEEGRTDG